MTMLSNILLTLLNPKLKKALKLNSSPIWEWLLWLQKKFTIFQSLNNNQC